MRNVFTILFVSTLFFSCKEVKVEIDGKLQAENVKGENSVQVKLVKLESIKFGIEGMTCAVGCAKTIEKGLTDFKGVNSVNVDFENKSATVDFDTAVTSYAKIKNFVESLADGKTYKVIDIK